MDNRIILCAGKLHYRVTLRHPHLYRLQLVEATKVISYVETGESFTVHSCLRVLVRTPYVSLLHLSPIRL